MLELYEQNRVVPPPRGSEPDGITGASNRQKLGNSQLNCEDLPSANGHSHGPLSSAAVQPAAGPSQGDDASFAFKRDSCADPENSGKYVANASYVKQNVVSVNSDTEQAYSENQGFVEDNVDANQPDGNIVTKQSVQDHLKYAEVKDIMKQDLDPSSYSRGRDKPEEGTALLKLNKTKLSAERPLNIADSIEQNEAMDSRKDVRERQDDELQENKLGDEFRGGLGSNDTERKKSYVGLDEINKDKVKAALEKRRKFRGEVTDSRATIRKTDLIDEDDLIERELESGVEAAAEAEKAKQERKESWSKSLHQGELEVAVLRKECTDEGEHGAKQKRANVESLCERRSRSFDLADPAGRDQEHDPTETIYDRVEEGELLNSAVIEQVHSPRHADRRSQIPNQLEKGGSPVSRRDYGGRDQHGHKDGSHDVKQRHNYHQYQHSYHQQHHHRVDVDRDRHYYKERDHKRVRHDHGK